MQKIYYENPYEKEFVAEIINVVEKNNEYHIELDRTNFYPGSLDNQGDTGFINEVLVTRVYEEENTIYHVIKTKPNKIHRVKCSIDWEKRYTYMQKHLAWNLLVTYFSELFNIKASDNPEKSNYNYIDLNGQVDETQIKKVEEMVNEIIFKNIAVEMIYPNKKELKKLSIQKNTKNKNDEVRVAKIKDFTAFISEGILPKSTIEIQMVKVNKYEKQGKGSRIHFICGNSAVLDYVSKFELMAKITKAFKCDESDIITKVDSISNEINNARSENALLKTKVADYEIQNMINNCESENNIKILKIVYENEDLKYINLLAKKLVEFPGIIVLFAIKDQEKANLLFMCSKDIKFISMNNLLKDAITLIDGKGGGSDFAAQGGGKNNNNLEAALDYAYNKVRTGV
ncbi:alanyl-tRNA editing protein [Clostridium grantii]|uniref:Alanine--tRNA ligase n=1 Tax=Clostridium grantii DSM 8605 TaxID=1121316 RepID=A0A1M5W048_9CLOT|nr:DHHA1 domain-containing protein [Clostridium grantii]SHH80543.1 alanyl-tRNA synthetase [Clostridium grantii DSM 8605]